MLHRMILVAVGANLPGPDGRTPLETCRWAVARVVERSGLALDACSHWYRSEPVPPSGQPDFVNGAVRLSGRADPFALLALLQVIEAEAGRVRTVPNAARVLDLDLVGIDALVIDSDELILPHPRLQDRAFVLAPLADIAPDWTPPGRDSVETLLRQADRTGLALISTNGSR